MGGIGSTGRRHERPNAMSTEGTRSSWMECGARGAGPGQEAQAGETGWPSRPGGSHWRGLGNYNRTVLPFKKVRSLPEMWRMDWRSIRLDVGKTVGVPSPGREYQWQQIRRGTGTER